MKGNFQVRFLGGRGRVTAYAYPVFMKCSNQLRHPNSITTFTIHERVSVVHERS